jgi:hypothetical protein
MENEHKDKSKGNGSRWLNMRVWWKMRIRIIFLFHNYIIIYFFYFIIHAYILCCQSSGLLLWFIWNYLKLFSFIMLLFTHLQYCIIIWGSTYSSCLYRIHLLQKRVIRIINREVYDAHTDAIFRNLNILKLKKIYLFQLGIFMYKCENNLLPANLASSFIRTNQVHNYSTRASRLFYVPSCRTNIRKFSANYQGPCFYNSLDAGIRDVASVSLFQSKLKIYLFNNWSM